MNISMMRSRSGAMPAIRNVSSTMGEMIVTGCARLIRASLYLLECILMSCPDGASAAVIPRSGEGVQPKILTKTLLRAFPEPVGHQKKLLMLHRGKLFPRFTDAT